jgi:hypothetical protein
MIRFKQKISPSPLALELKESVEIGLMLSVDLASGAGLCGVLNPFPERDEGLKAALLSRAASK